MRLIYVEDLEKFICENVCVIGDDHLLLVAGDDGMWHEALPLIRTAYDVDKVVEQLEAEKGTYFDGLPCEGTKITVNAAIEIVKAGEIDER